MRTFGTFGKFNIYTSTPEVNELQTVQRLRPNEIALRPSCTGLTIGYAVAAYETNSNSWSVCSASTEDECVEVIEKNKNLEKLLPNIFKFSDTYIYRTCGDGVPNWFLLGIVVEK